MPVIETVVGIDLGTSKIGAVIAEIVDDGEVQVVGVGTVASHGIRKGVVVEMEKAIDSIRDALDEAEQMAGVKVRDTYVGISGEHIRSLNSRGVVTVSQTKSTDRERIINPIDVNRVLERSREISLPTDREIIHVLPQSYTVDTQPGICDPIGISGMRLAADVHIVTGQTSMAQTINRCVKSAGINLHQTVLAPLAASYAVLSEDEKDLGVALLDIGSGTTDLAIWHEKAIRHTAVIPYGGGNITRDIAHVIGVPPDAAEKLKIEKGGALPPANDSQSINLEPSGDFTGRIVDPIELNSVIRDRMDEIFRLARREIKRVDYNELIAAGIVLTGGGALLKGAARLAEEVFKRPARVGCPRGIYGLADTVHNPAFSAAVGLILFALKNPEAVESASTRQHPRAATGLWASVRAAVETVLLKV
ncbi:MAG: cell division protein FtsA [Calditrichaeota bacterium]|nr:cell division protein FtsA [Calditrichota bacterium]